MFLIFGLGPFGVRGLGVLLFVVVVVVGSLLKSASSWSASDSASVGKTPLVRKLERAERHWKF